MARNTTEPIILLDGVCGLCCRAVRIVLKRDKAKVFRFAPMQSKAGRAQLGEFGLPAGNGGPLP